ncbi:hypothetical protein [Phytoactinopolyspora halophila]|uniref:hypothetical protein n=1 Tax=Phytoactinopolyspora halophila TaxID=1981511 RepID=UPI001FE61E97|nr:hypothetical protein [Phytoactinopolyspora halophila]
MVDDSIDRTILGEFVLALYYDRVDIAQDFLSADQQHPVSSAHIVERLTARPRRQRRRTATSLPIEPTIHVISERLEKILDRLRTSLPDHYSFLIEHSQKLTGTTWDLHAKEPADTSGAPTLLPQYLAEQLSHELERRQTLADTTSRIAQAICEAGTEGSPARIICGLLSAGSLPAVSDAVQAHPALARFDIGHGSSHDGHRPGRKPQPEADERSVLVEALMLIVADRYDGGSRHRRPAATGADRAPPSPDPNQTAATAPRTSNRLNPAA